MTEYRDLLSMIFDFAKRLETLEKKTDETINSFTETQMQVTTALEQIKRAEAIELDNFEQTIAKAAQTAVEASLTTMKADMIAFNSALSELKASLNTGKSGFRRTSPSENELHEALPLKLSDTSLEDIIKFKAEKLGVSVDQYLKMQE